MSSGKKNYIFGLKPDIDPVLFQLRYNESAKVIDYTKSQQWQVVSVSIGIHFGILSFFPESIDQAVSWILLIIVVLTSLFCLILLCFLHETAVKHRAIIEVLTMDCLIQSTIENKISNVKALYEDSRSASNNTFTILYIISIIFSLFLCLCVLYDRSEVIRNLLNPNQQFFNSFIIFIISH